MEAGLEGGLTSMLKGVIGDTGVIGSQTQNVAQEP